MKKKIILGILALLLVLQAQTVFAADYDERFCKELNDNDIDDIEDLLEDRATQMDLAYCMLKTLRAPEKYDKNIGKYNTDKFSKANCLEVLRLLVQYGADVNKRFSFNDGSYAAPPLGYAISYKHPISVIQFLLDSGANPNLYSDYSPLLAAYRDSNMQAVNLLLDRGANGAILLPELSSKGDNDFIKRLIAKGLQVRSNEGSEALRIAAESGKFDTVKLLVENGVNVNARDSKGITALSLAYDKGEMEIYSYLKSNGAIEFEPKQVAQPAAPAPAPSTTNVYVQPSAPTSSSSSSGSSTPSRNVGKEVADTISRAFEAPIENGRYRISGGVEELSFAGIATSGMVYYKDVKGTTHKGTYSIDGNRLTINVLNKSFFYSITSKTSFSGNGDAWFRVGF